jgi:nicotinate-nucleotide pyrophosphorylase (carboxylating)
VEGNARALLAAERTALNFAQRMSGIATPHAPTWMRCRKEARHRHTRKTTPALPSLRRRTVARTTIATIYRARSSSRTTTGRGRNRAGCRERRSAPHTSRIEIEVGISRARATLDARADVILFDNFDLARLNEAVRRAKGRAILEASGGHAGRWPKSPPRAST